MQNNIIFQLTHSLLITEDNVIPRTNNLTFSNGTLIENSILLNLLISKHFHDIYFRKYKYAKRLLCRCNNSERNYWGEALLRVSGRGTFSVLNKLFHFNFNSIIIRLFSCRICDPIIKNIYNMLIYIFFYRNISKLILERFWRNSNVIPSYLLVPFVMLNIIYVIVNYKYLPETAEKTPQVSHSLYWPSTSTLFMKCTNFISKIYGRVSKELKSNFQEVASNFSRDCPGAKFMYNVQSICINCTYIFCTNLCLCYFNSHRFRSLLCLYQFPILAIC
uniref:ABC2_membrane domain-containing protein n=1 Tax=Heterorhabditis bacteriophora TaxID=37862 RepID=A0A1I7W8C2_HETBA